jgi:hypothetical protein
MIRRSLLGSAFTALLFLVGSGSAAAQVQVEGWGGRANSAEILFRSTLYGAGTGLAVGGAYALARDEVDVSGALRWGTAGGAAGGMLIGLVYMIIESGEGDSGAIQLDEDGLRLSLMGALPEKRRDMAGVRGTAYDVSLFSVGFRSLSF